MEEQIYNQNQNHRDFLKLIFQLKFVNDSGVKENNTTNLVLIIKIPNECSYSKVCLHKFIY